MGENITVMGLATIGGAPTYVCRGDDTGGAYLLDAVTFTDTQLANLSALAQGGAFTDPADGYSDQSAGVRAASGSDLAAMRDAGWLDDDNNFYNPGARWGAVSPARY